MRSYCLTNRHVSETSQTAGGNKEIDPTVGTVKTMTGVATRTPTESRRRFIGPFVLVVVGAFFCVIAVIHVTPSCGGDFPVLILSMWPWGQYY